MKQSDFLVVALALPIALAGVFMALAVARAQARLVRQKFEVRLTNDGNAPSQYEVWAEPAGDATVDYNAVFEFRQNGVLLASWPMTQRRTRTSRSADSRLDQSPLADQAALAAAAQSALGTASSAAAPASSWLQGVTDLLGDVLPAEAGSRLRQWGAQARAGQAAVDRVDRNTARHRRLVASGASAMAAPRSATAESAHRQAERLDVVQTPALAPGQSLTLELTVRPAAPARAREVWFVVCARSLTAPEGDAGAAPVQVEASTHFGSASGVRFYLPYVMIFLVALVLIILIWIGARGA